MSICTCISICALQLAFILCVSQAATILHGNGHTASAISHQSFTRLAPAKPSLILRPQHLVEQPTVRKEEQPQLVSGLSRTPAHLTYSARPVVHQMLPRIKPVRNISYESLIPGPRSLTAHTGMYEQQEEQEEEPHQNLRLLSSPV
ncbi:uncharacterized protein LOC117588943 [Drosophila guanche]|uniref:Uncharacterized protein n=1 Tax=Drosophila guanche TaxID=7266 RepID=A0A3B0KFD4_DROGU|nr:uncharacterized protein LOC117588943 [Drosophila guanche]SPP87060.1 Hypothetical predicted protein [Drosophila guanche]